MNWCVFVFLHACQLGEGQGLGEVLQTARRSHVLTDYLILTEGSQLQVECNKRIFN